MKIEINPELQHITAYAIIQACIDVIEGDDLLPGVRFNRKDISNSVEPLIRLINPIMATKEFSESEMKRYKEFRQSARDMAAILERKEIGHSKSVRDAKIALTRIASNISHDIELDEERERLQKTEVGDQLIDLANHVKYFMGIALMLSTKGQVKQEAFNKKFDALVSHYL